MTPTVARPKSGGYDRYAEFFEQLGQMDPDKIKDQLERMRVYNVRRGQKVDFEARALDAPNAFDFPNEYKHDRTSRGTAVSIHFQHLDVLPEMPGLSFTISRASLSLALRKIGRHIFEYYGYLNEEHILFLAIALFSLNRDYHREHFESLFSAFPQAEEYTETCRVALKTLDLSHHGPSPGAAEWLVGVALQCGVELSDLELISDLETRTPLPEFYIERIAEWKKTIGPQLRSYMQTRRFDPVSPC